MGTKGIVKKVKALELVRDWALWPRYEANELDVTNLARIKEAILAGEALDPIIVESKGMRIVDGFHRHESYLSLYGEEVEINVEIRQYKTDADMFLDAAQLNAKGPLPLSPRDKVHCVLRLRKLHVPMPAICKALGITSEKASEFLEKRTALTKNGERIPLAYGAVPSLGGKDKPMTRSEEVFARASGGTLPIVHARLLTQCADCQRVAHNRCRGRGCLRIWPKPLVHARRGATRTPLVPLLPLLVLPADPRVPVAAARQPSLRGRHPQAAGVAVRDPSARGLDGGDAAAVSRRPGARGVRVPQAASAVDGLLRHVLRLRLPASPPSRCPRPDGGASGSACRSRRVLFPLATWAAQADHAARGEDAVAHALSAIVNGLCTWSIAFLAIGIAQRWFDRESPWIQYVSQSAYWVYLVHMPLVMFAGWQLVPYRFPAEIKFTLVCLFTALASLASFVEQAAVVGAEQVVALGLRNEFRQLSLRLGEEGADVAEKAVDLARAAEEDAAQHEA